MAYASRTGTRRNLKALRSAGWRLLVVAGAVLRTEGFQYALDNGAWSCHMRKVPFDQGAFEKALERLGDGADWIVLPDIVAGGLESLDFSLSWVDQVKPLAPILLPVQDGMGVDDVANLVGPDMGIFLGGTTDWKLSTMRVWGDLAARTGAYFHVARVNTARRIRLCQDAQASSFDGTSVTRFAKTLPLLDNERRQGHLFASPGKP
tara:strand:+ start:366 stop:983 length:618 start_codon:yes stop_codon:yes gene_type:complete